MTKWVDRFTVFGRKGALGWLTLCGSVGRRGTFVVEGRPPVTSLWWITPSVAGRPCFTLVISRRMVLSFLLFDRSVLWWFPFSLTWRLFRFRRLAFVFWRHPKTGNVRRRFLTVPFRPLWTVNRGRRG